MKDKKFWQGFLGGALSVITCVLLGCVIMTATGRIDLTMVLHGSSNSILNSSLQRKMTEIQSYVNHFFLDDIDQEKMQDAVCKGMVNGLGDTYAAYYNEEEYQDMKEKTSGNYCGIGAVVSQSATDGAISIVQTIKGGPAEKAGMKSGDMIVEVDGISTQGMDLTALISKTKGDAGTKVKVTVLRDGHQKK
ncbi:PDZ domain-containing protein, partial [Jutongia sp.]|uniref:S41 family peptidase n=1 Tax=Jutongia sp. TaxID=2944204 RepID=UPI0030790F04